MDHHFASYSMPLQTRKEMYTKPRYQPYGGGYTHSGKRPKRPSSPEYHPVFAEMRKREEELSTHAPKTYEIEFERLESMGFDNKPLNRYFLQQYNGDLTRVVSTLLELNDKNKNINSPVLAPLKPSVNDMTDDAPKVIAIDEDVSTVDEGTSM
jgi:hypothetical protein